ncbi:MAG: sarcosine oxidase subunit gamma family protein [Planctomycetota bacterium]
MSKSVSALGGASVTGAYIGIEEVGPLGQMTLRGDVGGAAMAALMLELTSSTVPDQLQVVAKGDNRVVWMSPDELLVILPRDGVAPAVARTGEVLGKAHHMALDVSDARALIRLSGAHVGEVLAKGVPCDVSEKAFPPGTARRTHLAGLAVGLWRVSPDQWEVVCFRSYAHHLVAWLEQAATPGSQVGWA